MNSSEISEGFERILATVQHLSGLIMLAFNSFVIFLIAKDNDARNMHYRKYLCTLQLFSLAFDLFSDLYAPIFLYHKGLFYSDSYLANIISVGQFLACELLMFGEVVISYIACIYYRRGVVLAPERRLNYYGWRRAILFISLQLYALAALFCMFYFYRKSIDASEPLLPAVLSWVKQRAAYLFIPDADTRLAHYVSDIAVNVLFAVGIAMLVQLVSEVKKGMHWSSATTRRYQQLAVKSLILQGAVPGLVYSIPAFINTGFQFAPKMGEDMDRFASFLSPILWMMTTTHTFISSLTMLYCSPSYQKRIVAFVSRHNFLPHRLSEWTRSSD